MKSNEFERLGDWQRKQEWGFNDALIDLADKREDNQLYPSSCIYTDRKKLVKKNNTRTLFKRK